MSSKRDALYSDDQFADRLTDWLSNISEQTCDTDQLNLLLQQDTEPVETIDTREKLEKFHRQYRVLFEEKKTAVSVEKKEKQTPTRKKAKIRFVKRMALVAAIVAVMTSGIVTAQALGVDVFGSIARWTTEFFALESGEVSSTSMAAITKRPEGEGPWSFQTIQEAFDSFGIEAEIAPTWLPKRFTESGTHEVYANDYNGVSIGEDYISGDSVYSFVIYEKDKVQSPYVEKDSREPDSILLDGQLYYVFNNGDIMNIVWESGDFTCCIFANITDDEMMQILHSIS